MRQIPEIKGLGFHIDAISFDPPIDSSDIDTSTWTKMAEIIEENYREFDGFVILHGTDTMAYSRFHVTSLRSVSQMAQRL